MTSPDHAKLVESLSYRSDPWSFDAVAAITALSEENERLKEALRQIAREQSARTATQAADYFQYVARAALGEKP